MARIIIGGRDTLADLPDIFVRALTLLTDNGPLFEAIGPITQQWTIEDLVAEGDKVVVRAINTCEQDSYSAFRRRDTGRPSPRCSCMKLLMDRLSLAQRG